MQCVIKTTLPAKRFIHTETQDGKSLVDAHFAVAMMHVQTYSVCRYLDEGNDAATPGQCPGVAASSSTRERHKRNGGLANTVAELIKINRSDGRHKEVVSLWKTNKTAFPSLGRVNEILYERVSENGDDGEVSVSAVLYSLSGIGNGIKCTMARSGTKFPTIVTAGTTGTEERTPDEEIDLTTAHEGQEQNDIIPTNETQSQPEATASLLATIEAISSNRKKR